MTIHAIPTRRFRTRADALVGMAIRALGRLAFAALVVFHAWLLCTHIIAGKALEPQTALRWLVSVGVLVGFRALSRRGLPLVFGRRATVLWLLVILIHCHAVWTGDAAMADLGVPETLGALAQLTGSISVLGALAVILFAAHVAAADTRRPILAFVSGGAGLPSDGFSFRYSPRPPPLA
jgi:hypothetical protein